MTNHNKHHLRMGTIQPDPKRLRFYCSEAPCLETLWISRSLLHAALTRYPFLIWAVMTGIIQRGDQIEYTNSIFAEVK